MKISKQGQNTVVDFKGGIIISDLYYAMEFEKVDHIHVTGGAFITTNKNREGPPEHVLEAINTIRAYVGGVHLDD